MSALKKIYEQSEVLKIDKNSKIVLMSDCHRGAGDAYDNFSKNENIFVAALNEYYKDGFTYIEIGDGDEMWEIKNYKDIVREHIRSFWLLKKFKEKDRLYMIYGNHDMVKKNELIMKDTFYKYYDKLLDKELDLLNDLKIYESLILDYHGKKMFLVHGHQVDFLNSKMWKVSRFLVRHVWKYLEQIGIKDPTSAAKNNKVSNKTEKRLKEWSKENNKIIIAGHTHRPIFPKVGDSLYFNDGSCIHPSGITAIEIANGKISLVKWEYEVDDLSRITVNKKLLEKAINIENFYYS